MRTPAPTGSLEFTQLDIEMSFADVDDVLEVTEGLMKRVFEEAGDIPVQTPFLRLPLPRIDSTLRKR